MDLASRVLIGESEGEGKGGSGKGGCVFKFLGIGLAFGVYCMDLLAGVFVSGIV